ncbi:MAG: riboflavin synthase [bacterium]|nr:riboflavin synthase [bacterium]
MFSGLVEATARVLHIDPEPGGIRLSIQRPADFHDVALGDSIAVSGCCLTVVQVDEAQLSFQAGQETLSKTILGGLSVGSRVNCERSLALGDRLGGHLVTGHVDAVATLRERRDDADWSDMVFACPLPLLSQIAPKGSVTVDGVSLTVVAVGQDFFSVALIPHTLEHTTLGERGIGQKVNIETDLLAKYVQRQLETSKS